MNWFFIVFGILGWLTAALFFVGFLIAFGKIAKIISELLFRK